MASSSCLKRIPRRLYSTGTAKPAFTYTPAPADAKHKDGTSSDPRAAPLKPLSRPLGVPDRPTIFNKTFKERISGMLDAEAVKAHNRHLWKEYDKSSVSELGNLRFHGGKTWIAPTHLIREDKSLYLPNLTGKCLLDGSKKHSTTMCFGKITVLSLLTTQVSDIHNKGFTHSTLARYGSNPLYQHLQINIQENLLKAMLVNVFASSLRSIIPYDLQQSYLVSNQNMEYIRGPMGITNTRVGYVFLVDENLKIRWAGNADAMPEEAQALEVCTGVLLERLAKKPKQNVAKVQDLSSSVKV